MPPPEPSDAPRTLPSGAPQVRAAAIADVVEIHHLIESYAEMGNLLPRPMSELYRHLRDFFVVTVDQRVVACGALEVFTESLGEIRSLVVAKAQKGQGLGRLLVERLVQEARHLGLQRVMALTYVPEFFHKLGFHTVAKDTLPEKVWGICVKCYKYHRCDEVAVIKEWRAASGE